MRIIFGTGYFTIRKADSSLLNLSITSKNDFRILLIQRYAHLFFIPIYPLSQEWIIKDKNGIIYAPTGDLVDHLAGSEYETPTPWYSYAGLLMVLAGFLFLSAQALWDGYKRNQALEADYQRTVSSYRQIVAQPAVDDYYQINPLNYSSVMPRVARVASVTGTAVKLVVVSKSNFFLSDYSNPDELATYFSTKADSLPSFWVSRSKLLQVLDPEFRSKQVTALFPGDTTRYYLQQANRFTPTLKVIGATENSDSTYFVTIANYGSLSELHSIRSQQGNFVWALPHPVLIPYHTAPKDDIQFVGKRQTAGKPTFQFDLVGVSASSATTFVYRIESKNGSAVARRIR